ncbi:MULTISPECIES: hypothetical protein [unclassified Pseudomonas]|uniref:hypothetical protein n=1 Tax=unclassified Pseudomonas TaxID=196821 RepID=UPI001032FED4|nr:MULTISPECIES: hypothetical protein [unclassified Pseudomonas]
MKEEKGMALISCPGCGLHQSDKAWTCSGCQHVLRIPKRGVFGRIFKWSFIFFNPMMGGWMIYELSTAESASIESQALIITAVWVVGGVNLGLLVLFTHPSNEPPNNCL